MAGLHRGCGGLISLVMLTLTLQLASAQDNNVAANVGKPMELTAPFLAVTPAAADAPSSGPGPIITEVTRNPSPRPAAGNDLPVTAIIQGSPTDVRLSYLVGYGPVEEIPMTSGTGGRFLASIPASAFKAGSMVRWFVSATDLNQATSRLPPASEGYYGTVINDPTVDFKIPVMEWFTNDISGSTAITGANGSSVYFLGRFYDNMFVRRKGVTSLTWPKPKLKFELLDSDFIYKPVIDKSVGERKVAKFDLNSLYYEPGQKSYMREAIAYQVLQDVGAVSAVNYHIILRANGAFYGLYTYTENDDNDYLTRNGVDKAGVLIKPTSGSNGNLAFNVAQDQLQYSYQLQNHKKTTSYWPQLHAFTQGIAGATDVPRSVFVFDNVELSETINTMAVLSMLLTQDRCTKNYLMYLDLGTNKWQMFAYDLKSALNADAGYGGRAAIDYCILECTQWNSPLYCDRDHPQDVTTTTTSPWTSISASNISGRRRMLQRGAGVADNGPSGANANITNPDVNLASLGSAPSGASGTFNYLVDLITQVPHTRQMYMRRLRTLTDAYYPSGKLAGMVTDMYNRIKEAANTDNEKWRIGDITLGYKQLIEEQIPTRQMQLLETYGPQGTMALLPDSQPPQPALTFGRIDSTSPSAQQFVEIMNGLDYAVDVSNWRITGSATMTLKPGTVVAAGNSLIVAMDSVGFKQRSAPPTTGQGFQVIGGLQGNLGGDLQLVDDGGAPITTSGAAKPAVGTSG